MQQTERRTGREVAALIGRVGVWSFAFDPNRVTVEQDAVAEIEDLGFPALWIPEALGSKDALAHASVLLAGGRRIVVATGIANIWARDPVAMANGGKVLADAYPGRFLLGIGVSHRTTVDRRGAFTYRSPLTRMKEYLDGMDAARYPVRDGVEEPPRVLAALGPKMLRLAAERAAGAHPYFVPVEHTAGARETLGPDPLLAPEQAVVLETDPAKARDIARNYMSHYLKLENYAANLMRLGWTQEEISGASDKLVDAIVAWGDGEAIRARVREHLDAGADHVSVQPLGEDPRQIPLPQLRELAPALLE